MLSQFSITHVLGVGEDLPIALSESSRIPRVKTKTAAAKGDQYTYKEKGVSYMVLAVPDSEETALLNFMHGCFEFIDAALNVRPPFPSRCPVAPSAERLSGSPNLSPINQPCFAPQDPDHGRHNRVMVMCASGMSASATVLGSYLICRRKLPLAVCMGKMREAHPAVEPNKGFARHLRFLERNGELPEWSMP